MNPDKVIYDRRVYVVEEWSYLGVEINGGQFIGWEDPALNFDPTLEEVLMVERGDFSDEP